MNDVYNFPDDKKPIQVIALDGNPNLFSEFLASNCSQAALEQMLRTDTKAWHHILADAIFIQEVRKGIWGKI